ncbi:uncharacterized protein AB675_9439 [Cyphellophora attinorum]|uniref:Ribosomal protein/NADH dehydrogenase domain-containing protein n=1 Tax=Cyphellophora attinorum TaxID=1664694 RepID=A0A0N1NX74_9EURO|nr:uncharacterized protein AB675_9439 [Phialophora attinorum]KPI34715.1 hypothetical protein AB675_9439 [Phialophora attinorum]
MVHIARRAAVFRPKLLDIRSGIGALILPADAKAQLTSVLVRYRKVTSAEFQDEATRRRVQGAYNFAKFYLPRLKYHNPTLKIDVQRSARHPNQIELEFESKDPAALLALEFPRKNVGEAAKSSRSAATAYLDSAAKAEQAALEELEAESSTQEVTEAAADTAAKTPPETAPDSIAGTAIDTASAIEAAVDPTTGLSTSKDQTKTPQEKPFSSPQEEKAYADLASKIATAIPTLKIPEGRKPPPTYRVRVKPDDRGRYPTTNPTYTRKIQLPVNDREDVWIFNWFKNRTGAKEVTNAEDRKMREAFQEKEKRAVVDRAAFYERLAIKKNQEATLEAIRKRAEQNAAEANAPAGMPV